MILATVAGYIGQDPQYQHTDQGVSVVNFTVAHTAPKTKETTWVKVVAWRGLADLFAKYVTKGEFIVLVGDLELDQYEDRSGGQRSQLKITVNSFNFGPKMGDSGF